MHPGFSYLEAIDPTILQDMRYATSNNFVGRPIEGYCAPRCIVALRVGEALARVQKDARAKGFSLKVFDAYRPQRAVDDFARWSQDPTSQETKAFYYPNVDKSKLFEIGFIALKSQHSRGCAVDLTLVPMLPDAPCHHDTPYYLFSSQELDMGTAFDVFDDLSHTANPNISQEAQHNRKLLLALMAQHGFNNYSKEWWHFSLENEPFPGEYFDFPVK